MVALPPVEARFLADTAGMIGPLNAVDRVLLSNAHSFSVLDSQIDRYNLSASQMRLNSVAGGTALSGMSFRAAQAGAQMDALGRQTLNYANIVARLNATTRTAQFGNVDTFLRNQSFLANSHLDIANAQRRNTTSARNLNNANTRLSGGLQTLAGRIFAVSAIAGTAAASLGVLTRRTVEYADLNVDVNNRLRLVTESENAQARVRERLREISRGTRSELFANATAYSRLALASEDLGRSEEELLRVVEILNRQLIIGGSNAEEARSGVIQLLQGIASNRLQGDELRSVLENLLGVSRGLVMGFQELERQGEISFRVTRGNFRELAAEGTLTADLLIRAILASGEATDEAFQEVEFGITRSLTNIRTEVTELFDVFEDRTGTFEAFGDRLEGIAEFLNQISNNPAFQVVAGISAGGVRFTDQERLSAADDFQLAGLREDARGFGIDADTFREAAAALREGVVSNREAAEIFDRFFLDTEEGYIAAAEAIADRARQIREANEEITDEYGNAAEAVSRYRNLISEARRIETDESLPAAEAARRAAELRAEATEQIDGLIGEQLVLGDAIIGFVRNLRDVREEVDRTLDDLDVAGEDFALTDRNRPSESFRIPAEATLGFEPPQFSDAFFELQEFENELAETIAGINDDLAEQRAEQEAAEEEANARRREHLNEELRIVEERIAAENAVLEERGLYILSLETEEEQLRALNAAFSEDLAGRLGLSIEAFNREFNTFAQSLGVAADDLIARNELLNEVSFFGLPGFGFGANQFSFDGLDGADEDVDELGIRWESTISRMVRSIGRLDTEWDDWFFDVLRDLGAQFTTAALTSALPTGRQTGGYAGRGEPIFVGEGGQPEVFIPESGGTVFPQSAFGGNQYEIVVQGGDAEQNRRMLVQDVLPLIDRIGQQQFLARAQRIGTPENRTVRFS